MSRRKRVISRRERVEDVVASAGRLEELNPVQYESWLDDLLTAAEREPWGLAEVALYTDVVPTTASHRIRAGSAGHPMAYAHLRSGPLVDADEVRAWAAANPDRCGTRSPIHTPGVERVNP